MPGQREPADLWDSWLQDVLGESQCLAMIPKAWHLWESEMGAILKPQCEKLALQRTENFPERGLWLMCLPPLRNQNLTDGSVPVLGTGSN